MLRRERQLRRAPADYRLLAQDSPEITDGRVQRLPRSLRIQFRPEHAEQDVASTVPPRRRGGQVPEQRGALRLRWNFVQYAPVLATKVQRPEYVEVDHEVGCFTE